MLSAPIATVIRSVNYTHCSALLPMSSRMCVCLCLSDFLFASSQLWLISRRTCYNLLFGIDFQLVRSSFSVKVSQVHKRLAVWVDREHKNLGKKEVLSFYDSQCTQISVKCLAKIFNKKNLVLKR